jgi:hypothetical protein
MSDYQPEQVLTPEQIAIYEANVAAQIAAGEARLADALAQESAIEAIRSDLKSSLDLIKLSPAPTPEEQAIAEATVNNALQQFRDLDNPPADITALTAAVLTLEMK